MANVAAGVLGRPENEAKALCEEQRNGAPRRRGGNRVEEAPAPHASASRELFMKGEEAAARFLSMRGYEILERNWACFAGEVDIIARDGRTLVFVEVKIRRDLRQGFPSEAMSAEKRDRFEKMALAYAAEYEETDIPVRFDMVAIVVVADNKAMIRHDIDVFSIV